MLNKEILNYLAENNSNKEIVEEYESLDITYQGAKHTISVGDKASKLTVVALVQYRQGNVKRKGCICKCSCSENSYIGPSRLYMLLSGDLISCGCESKRIHSEMFKDRNTIHGDSCRGQRSSLYSMWVSMRDRAHNVNRPDAKYYSLKGIEVCDEWEDYKTFKSWALSNGYVEGLTIERKDVEKGYFPDNCTFIPANKQNDNKTNSRLYEYKGEVKTLTDWCRELGVSWTTLESRLVNHDLAWAIQDLKSKHLI